MENKGILAIIILVVIIAIRGYIYMNKYQPNYTTAQSTIQNSTVNETHTIHTESQKL
ncbi:MAG: hypothetical protein QMD61_08295 [Methanobacterium sp.]|nr:hypothetical protein [Methanobacterium sp.]